MCETTSFRPSIAVSQKTVVLLRKLVLVFVCSASCALPSNGERKTAECSKKGVRQNELAVRVCVLRIGYCAGFAAHRAHQRGSQPFLRGAAFAFAPSDPLLASSFVGKSCTDDELALDGRRSFVTFFSSAAFFMYSWRRSSRDSLR